MSFLVICSVAVLASGLTFFSGFGLGTLLLPAFALFFAVEKAVALTAIVHFLNGLFKLALVWRHIDRGVALRFGLPAIVGAFAGAWLLVRVAETGALFSYVLFDRAITVEPVKLIIGILLLCFACAEMLPAFRRITFGPQYQPLGGLLSGFFGGLAGMQGALRSAFLVKSGLDKSSYVATGAAIAFLIDVSRLSIYAPLIIAQHGELDYTLLAAAVIAALAGSLLGNRYLHKATLPGIQIFVAILLFIVALGLISGLL
jgi:uncharacterized membrane protein YfcA